MSECLPTCARASVYSSRATACTCGNLTGEKQVNKSLAKWQLEASQMPQWPTVNRDELVELINYTDSLECTLIWVRDQLVKAGWSASEGGVIHRINTTLREKK